MQEGFMKYLSEAWTREKFLYDAFLTRHTRTSPQRSDTPIEIYNAYLEQNIDINKLCEIGADIMNFVMGCGLKRIEPVFMRKHIWWCFASKKLFGLNLFQHRPYLTFTGLDQRLLDEVYHKENYEFEYREQYSQYVCKSEVGVKDLITLFEIRVEDISSTS